ncbi:MAG: hypothetical protein CME86_00575 [Herbaspirillum sp.]|nr:hypothetical protein [Herbaspirillum sp.]MBO15649.1 hypothetical protein [Herbaspirillum sp.]|tara:strand:- start:69 stop:302 length:234 start_codon:yes stop_codon:yes gene_type:complete
MCRDLFGEVPVTEDDVYRWVQAISPRWLTPERSYLNYVRTWGVVDKIKQAKLRGDFESIIDRPQPAYHVRFALNAII